MRRLFIASLLLISAITFSLSGSVAAQTPLPPQEYSSVDTTSTAVLINIPMVPAGEPAPSGIGVGFLWGNDVGMPGYWAQGEKDFYPWTPCIKDMSFLNRQTYVDEEAGLAFPGATVGEIMNDPLMGRCVMSGDTGQYEIVGPNTPLPDINIPVTAVSGNFPVPGAILTEEYGRHAGYFGGNPYHTGVDFVGSAQISVGDITLPRQTIFTPFPCEPVWVRAGVITCATPMPLNGAGEMYDPETWASYWLNNPDGLTLLLTYLHVNTCNATNSGQIGLWNQYKSLLRETEPGYEPEVFAGTLSQVMPVRGSALTTYCAAPTAAACGTTASHLHLGVTVVTNAKLLPYLRRSGEYRIQPSTGCAGTVSRWGGGWWGVIASESVTPIAMWKSFSEQTPVISEAVQCFGGRDASATLSDFRDRLLDIGGGQLPTPHQIFTDPAYAEILNDWMSWSNSFAASTQFGLNAPVPVMPCIANPGVSLRVRDQGYPGGYPGLPARYSSSCAPTYPSYPSRSCTIFEYIPTPGGQQSTFETSTQYRSGAARALFFNVWWQIFGD